MYATLSTCVYVYFCVVAENVSVMSVL